ncbi:hormogonium polysaccharide biosynthesis protein HpsA [Microcoleus sp. FACHB-672]|uniref:hormogonium polysaccharide biosynthesis protein HpsA n=1 Tax=Microcoleus sp. FACHB-672 TaxID=2692825 RepID=UPI001685D6FB|nr:hormogonium polysaccharide biosynthesis protein HpsA [Microcoleus sp. FACHB-672]MBD2040594.1 hypothetical protein [Microcoleus sp. FACHB-672]
MAKHKFNKTFARLLREIVKLFKTLTGQFTRWFLRTFLVAGRWGQRQGGFVLPTIALMLMVVALLVTAIMFRTFNRTTQVMGEVRQEQINNAATPAVERAKSKIEYLFSTDLQTLDIPPEDSLEKLLTREASAGATQSPYQFPDETPVSASELGLSGFAAGERSAAWKYDTDTNGDGKADATTIYAILARAKRGDVSIYPEDGDNDTAKANNFVTRNGPVLTQQGKNNEDCTRGAGGTNLPGWFEQGTANVYKAIQVYAITVPKTIADGLPTNNSALATLQYQQDRRFSRSNKWGAWFRYDLDVYPGDPFNWNGAMYSQGSIFTTGNTNNENRFRAYPISSQDSCFYNPSSNSAIVAKGEFVSGRVRDNKIFPIPRVQIHAWTPTGQVNTYDGLRLESNLDSVGPDSSTDIPIAISTDPLALHTRGVSLSRKEAGAGWNKAEVAPSNEILSSAGGNYPRVQTGETYCAPYVDDTYRADNRFGPKPSYSKEIQEFVIDENGEEKRVCKSTPSYDTIGKVITSNPTGLNLINNVPPTADLPDDVGLDGYWERRARNEGLRLIVGQRLELGNTFGWVEEEDNLDPLYPPDPAINPEPDRRNEIRQYRTLRDNLAAVQSTAVYHYTQGDTASTANISEGGYWPIAYVATTAHPGNQNTLSNSTTFRRPLTDFTVKNTPQYRSLFGTNRRFGNERYEIITNFFTGDGTNGWEFSVLPGVPTLPPATENAYTSATGITNDNSDLRKALRNLAQFAGDPDGFFPPLQENGTVHPYPLLTMWGNFSNLRESVRLLDTGNYNDLSLADKTNIQTAAGTLGMLAYNISFLDAYDVTANANTDELTDIGLAAEISDIKGDIPPATLTELEAKGELADYILSALDRAALAAPNDEEAQQRAFWAKFLHTKDQVERDRTLGFTTTGTYTSVLLPALNLGDISARGDRPKFPSLHSIFPRDTGGFKGKGTQTSTVVSSYINDPYIFGNTGVNTNVDFEFVEPSEIALLPRDLSNPGDCSRAFSCLPARTTVTASGTTPPAANIINDFATDRSASAAQARKGIALLDKGMFDGREMMNVRVLDVDLDLLRKTEKRGTGDVWLPKSGLVYAFREDAVREDAIARPAFSNWAAYQTTWANTTGNPAASNIMRPWEPADPPLCQLDPATAANQLPQCLSSSDRGISPKPVDYYADPDRRPYGFRLRNGMHLKRIGLPDADNQRGMTFVSDNPVYIMGHFNLHTDSASATATNNLEEFDTRLQVRSDGRYSNFYSRGDKNNDFANFDEDEWRVTEIIGDAINILSGNFYDGTVESGILNSNPPDVANNQNSSYRNSNMWKDALATTQQWVCENPYDIRQTGTGANAQTCNGPIKIFRNGEVKSKPTTSNDPTDYTPYTEYRLFSAKNRALNNAVFTQVNSVLVSGVVASRANQANGGFHNFPRLNEYWGQSCAGIKPCPLGISGSMVQLNFSNYATAPYDQDAWEPQNPAPGTSEAANYYVEGGASGQGSRLAPTRRWGYDVGLQYQPAGPVSKRMVTLDRLRSEFYREPEVNDPYICMLRRAVNYPCQ